MFLTADWNAVEPGLPLADAESFASPVPRTPHSARSPRERLQRSPVRVMRGIQGAFNGSFLLQIAADKTHTTINI